ncbi:hypothetical protein OHC33_009764 [Knufia fluminis]|uniref:Sulfhydryl oxidase n=1 Tax=Knufia fluminis TaxID=191047 RepID=A0AAN8EDZ9_9EURO|nr:hypothetical protein OHC33_009764 [Knufia fluminis]
MPRAPPPGFYVLSTIALFIWFILYTRNHDVNRGLSHIGNTHSTLQTDIPALDVSSSSAATTGTAIMPSLGNETAKAELGRASWKLFHTIMSRFPDTPTPDESKALKEYIHLFARLYPCGECATHFQQILKKYPPQVSSRSSAAAWACFVHNEVNVSKGKPVFDCADIGDWYDCGCADDEKSEGGDVGKQKQERMKEKIVAGELVEIEKDGLMNGG